VTALLNLNVILGVETYVASYSRLKHANMHSAIQGILALLLNLVQVLPLHLLHFVMYIFSKCFKLEINSMSKVVFLFRTMCAFGEITLFLSDGVFSARSQFLHNPMA
jgi:hypothetical protein